MSPAPLQLESLLPSPGISLIEASAGTGKTYSISQTVSRWVAGGHFTLPSILVLTFTEAAASELKTRIRQVLQDHLKNLDGAKNPSHARNLKIALADFDTASIHTIHGFCHRMLREYPVQCGIPLRCELITDDSSRLEASRRHCYRLLSPLLENFPRIAACPASGKSLENLIKRVEKVLSDVWDPPVSPQSVDSLQTLAASIQRSLDALATQWQTDASEVRTLFLQKAQCPIQQRAKIYKSEGLLDAFDLLDQWAADPHTDADGQISSCLKAFSRTALANVLKKGKTLPGIPFFDSCEEIRERFADWEQGVCGLRVHTEQASISDQINGRGLLRFDDIQHLLRNTLRRPDSPIHGIVQKRFQAVFVDEFQDTDPVQFEILKLLFHRMGTDDGDKSSRPPVVLIGDPKQAIYGFRGGDIFTCHAASRLARRHFFLDTNWRSCRKINDAINHLLSTDAPFRFDWIHYNPVKTAPENGNASLIIPHRNSEGEYSSITLSGLQFRILSDTVYKNEFKLLEEVAADIDQLVSSGGAHFSHQGNPPRPLRFSDIAVLLPSNHQTALLNGLLSKKDIPSIVFGGASVFASREADDLLQVMKGIIACPRSPEIRACLSTSLFGYSSSRIASIDPASQEWDDMLVPFSQARSAWMLGSLSEGFALLESTFEWKQNLASLPRPERRLANHNHLLEVILEEDRIHHGNPQQLLRWYEQKLLNPDPREQEQLIRLDREGDAVTLLTLHKSKGLEFPVVYLPILSAGKTNTKKPPPYNWHDPEGNRHQVISETEDHEDARSAFIKEQQSEQCRLHYVALTRAKVLCRVFLPDQSKLEGPTLSWIRSASGLPEDSTLDDCIAALQDHTKGAISLQEYTPPGVYPATLREKDRAELPDWADISPPSLPPASQDWWSFSGLIHGIERDADHDTMIPTSNAAPVLLRDQDHDHTLHAFDRGTSVGNLFHALLETVDFTEPASWQSRIDLHLSSFGYHPAEWSLSFVKLLQSLSCHSLGGLFPGGILGRLPLHERFCEPEFTFPLNFKAPELDNLNLELAKEDYLSKHPYRIPPVTGQLSNSSGFMKGFIDLWFQDNNRIYLVDWKSNYLGENLQAYSPDNLLLAMNQHHYHLQYLIYICALNRFLRLVIPGYNYEDHFGSIAYVFLRGIDPDRPDHGVFACKPAPGTIDVCERWLSC